MLIEDVLVLMKNEAGKELAVKRLPFFAQQVGHGQIRFDDPISVVHRQIANRREIVEIDILVASLHKFFLNPAQLLVLQFQFDLMGFEFMKRLAEFVRAIPGRGINLGSKQFFRPLAQCIKFPFVHFLHPVFYEPLAK